MESLNATVPHAAFPIIVVPNCMAVEVAEDPEDLMAT